MISQTDRIIPAPESTDRAWLPGLAHAVVSCAAAPVLGIAPCIAGILVAALVSFVVYVPLTVLALNGGEALAEDAEAPPLPPGARLVLLALWTATVWAVAVLA